MIDSLIGKFDLSNVEEKKTAYFVRHSDETYIKVRGKCRYLYCVIDQGGSTFGISNFVKKNLPSCLYVYGKISESFWKNDASRHRQSSFPI